MSDMPSDMEEVKKLLWNLDVAFWENMRKAYDSGAFDPSEHTIVGVGRAVLVITADQFSPISESDKELLANLRHFV